METRFHHLLHKLRANLWFVPSLMTLGAVALSAATLAVDARMAEGAPYGLLLFTAGAAGASSLLTTIAGSMMAVTGVTFSITVVALSLASTQLGPRLLRSFIRDRSNQFVLGTFLATFTYSLLILRAVDQADARDGAPEASVTVAILLAMASLAVLIYFVHHVAVSIQADTVIATVHAELEANIDRMYPERMGEAHPERDGDLHALPPDFHQDTRPIHAAGTGYLQAVDEDAVMAAAEEQDILLVIRCKPGDFVAEGAVLMVAWPAARVPGSVEERLRRAFLLGRRRTTEQDVEFSIDQLVEVGVRALSPSLNDPFTALRCVDRLGVSLAHICERRIPSPLRAGRDGRLRVVLRRANFQGLVDAAFDQLRQHGRGSVAVTMRLLEAIESTAGAARTETQRAHLQRHADKVLRTSLLESQEESDRRAILERHERALAALAHAQARLHRDPTGQQPS